MPGQSLDAVDRKRMVDRDDESAAGRARSANRNVMVAPSANEPSRATASVQAVLVVTGME